MSVYAHSWNSCKSLDKLPQTIAGGTQTRDDDIVECKTPAFRRSPSKTADWRTKALLPEPNPPAQVLVRSHSPRSNLSFLGYRSWIV